MNRYFTTLILVVCFSVIGLASPKFLKVNYHGKEANVYGCLDDRILCIESYNSYPPLIISIDDLNAQDAKRIHQSFSNNEFDYGDKEIVDLTKNFIMTNSVRKKVEFTLQDCTDNELFVRQIILRDLDIGFDFAIYVRPNDVPDEQRIRGVDLPLLHRWEIGKREKCIDGTVKEFRWCTSNIDDAITLLKGWMIVHKNDYYVRNTLAGIAVPRPISKPASKQNNKIETTKSVTQKQNAASLSVADHEAEDKQRQSGFTQADSSVEKDVKFNTPFPVFGKVVYVDEENHPVDKKEDAVGYYTRTICNRLEDYDSKYLVSSKIQVCDSNEMCKFNSSFATNNIPDDCKSDMNVLAAEERMCNMKNYLSRIFTEYFEYGFSLKGVYNCQAGLNKACCAEWYWRFCALTNTPYNAEMKIYNQIGKLLDALDGIHKSEFFMWRRGHPYEYSSLNKKYLSEVRRCKKERERREAENQQRIQHQIDLEVERSMAEQAEQQRLADQLQEEIDRKNAMMWELEATRREAQAARDAAEAAAYEAGELRCQIENMPSPPPPPRKMRTCERLLHERMMQQKMKLHHDL